MARLKRMRDMTKLWTGRKRWMNDEVRMSVGNSMIRTWKVSQIGNVVIVKV